MYNYGTPRNVNINLIDVDSFILNNIDDNNALFQYANKKYDNL